MIREANMLILFGIEAPADLAEYCYKISNKDLSYLYPGWWTIGHRRCGLPNYSCRICCRTKSLALGHITIAFDGSEDLARHWRSRQDADLHANSIVQLFA